MPEKSVAPGSARKPKICFYLENKHVPHADLRFPEKGNPGIGGSEFGLVTLPYFFSLNYNDFDLLLYANVTNYLPKGLTVRQADSSITAVHNAIEDNCQILIVRLSDSEINPEFIREISENPIKVIVWAQNNPSSNQMKMMDSCKNIRRLVCVGHEELDILRDHQIIYKTTCIFNGIYLPPYIQQRQIIGNGNTVVYVGSLVREKGFHILAKAWPHVRVQVPEARLSVIGSGQVYNESAILGKWGVAEENYEKEFRQYLSDKNGNPESSVEFLGKLGVEKISIMQQADVGVVNPNLNPYIGTETFCWSAVEFEACGTPVVSAARDGLLDTVQHQKTGLLIRNESGLAKYIVQLLKDRNLRGEYSRNAMEFVSAEFDYGRICSQWRTLFIDVIHDRPNTICPMKVNVFYNYKFLREFMRRIKLRFPRFKCIPALVEFREIGRIVFLIRRRILGYRG